jgi:hypothetical protein
MQQHLLLSSCRGEQFFKLNRKFASTDGHCTKREKQVLSLRLLFEITLRRLGSICPLDVAASPQNETLTPSLAHSSPTQSVIFGAREFHSM